MRNANRIQNQQSHSLTHRKVEVTFRSLSFQDAPELAYCELQIFKIPWSENSLRNCLELSTVEGEAAIIQEKIVGYLMIQSVLDEAHVLNLGVLPAHRGKGIARMLLERYLRIAMQRKIAMIYLEVRAGNRAAQNLYFSLGFAPISARRKYYPDGEDALILMRKL